ncbi:MAG: type II toxin-antitoxin system VapC family toxin [Terracidiphilus sp.]|jgi:PIN domain nuclease of toxin-antitoxin system
MRLLADTHIVYWFFLEPEKLPPAARKHLDAASAVYVSAASIWEIAIKVKLGKLKADPERLVQRIDASGMRELPVFSRHTALVANLPLLHSDPFDRLLIAQAISEPLHLLTVDPQLRQYSELVIQV